MNHDSNALNLSFMQFSASAWPRIDHFVSTQNFAISSVKPSKDHSVKPKGSNIWYPDPEFLLAVRRWHCTRVIPSSSH
jgi:hypothetical protein